MDKYALIDKMDTLFAELEFALDNIQQQLAKLTLLSARIFILPDIEKGTEHDPIEQISVTPIEGQEACYLGLQHFRRLFIHHNNQNISSKAAVRLPGVMCFSVNNNEYLSCLTQISKINTLKSELEHIITVESGLPSEQRFEFVHTHLRGLITLNTYRTLIPLINPSSVRFGWANKHVIKNITRKDLLTRLEKSLNAGRAIPPFTREQRVAWISKEIDEVQQLPEKARLLIKRPVKVQPISRVWYQEQQKQVQHPCSMPLIALCENRHGVNLPKMGELKNYDVTQVKHKYKPNARPLRLLLPRLHLYTYD
ncbi:DNA replication terminus site-binding protein [Candidatus Fukatsuia endosymbiont of Tuberolachnus salignus]|uniref:DNA replication terminus site-binding protein n=1 Tax=Candidatus Fukatsuia endosymbiont of Tuberolachnus salignus TaxID=3077957 RepID=UPI00313A7C4C